MVCSWGGMLGDLAGGCGCRHWRADSEGGWIGEVKLAGCRYCREWWRNNRGEGGNGSNIS